MKILQKQYAMQWQPVFDNAGDQPEQAVAKPSLSSEEAMADAFGATAFAHNQMQNLRQPEPAGLDWTPSFTVSPNQFDSMVNAQWAYKNLVIDGHLAIFPAPPNGGKTTIFLHIAAVMASKGYRVMYINADVSCADAKAMQELADQHGFELLLPDFHAGRSMQDIVTHLEAMSKESLQYTKTVFIFDTLKKMTDIIQKAKAKRLLQTLRSLTAKGITVICLAHTNKHKAADGSYIYEGTGDVRADVDELIYMEPEKHSDGSMTVSTRPDKVRGIFQPIAFKINPDRTVEQLEGYSPTESIDPANQRIIDAITDTLLAADGQKQLSQTDLVTEVRKVTRSGDKQIRKVLKNYDGDIWHGMSVGANNRKVYELLKNDESPKSDQADQSENTEL